MKLSDMETEPQAHPIILAPSLSKLSYYLLMREYSWISGKNCFNFNETNVWNWKLLWVQLNQMETFQGFFFTKFIFIIVRGDLWNWDSVL